MPSDKTTFVSCLAADQISSQNIVVQLLWTVHVFSHAENGFYILHLQYNGNIQGIHAPCKTKMIYLHFNKYYCLSKPQLKLCMVDYPC